MFRARAQPAKPIQIGALHETFFVHIGTQENPSSTAPLMDHGVGLKICCLLPAFPPPLFPPRISAMIRRSGPGHRHLAAVRAGTRLPDNDPMRTPAQHQHARPARGTGIAATYRALGGPSKQSAPTRSSFEPLPHRGIQIDHLNLGNAANRSIISRGVLPSSAFSRPHKLHHFARPSGQCKNITAAGLTGTHVLQETLDSPTV